MTTRKYIAGAFLALAMFPVLSHPASAKDVTITLWSHEKKGIDPAPALVKEFNALNNGIQIEYREMQYDDLASEAIRAYAIGKPPDIITIDNPEHALFASNDAFLDITDMVAESDVIKIENYYPGPVASATWENRLYGLPKATNTIALYYNADMFRAKGLDPENPPRTWDELLEAARILTDPAANTYGIAFSAKANEEGTFQFLPWVQTGGGSYDNINTEGAVKGLEIWRTLLAEKLASPDTLTRGQWDSTGTFNSGNAAMAISGPWEIDRMLQDAKFDWRVTLMPVMELGAEPASAMGDFNWAIFSGSEHPKEAFKVIEYFASQDDKMFENFGVLPARSDISLPPTGYEKKDAALKVFLEQMKYAEPRGPHPDWPKISRAIQDAIQATLSGQSTAKDALDRAAKRIKAITDES